MSSENDFAGREPVPSSVDVLDERISRPTPGVLDTIGTHRGDFAVLGAAGKMGFHLCRTLQRALCDLGRQDRVIAVSRFSDPDSRSKFDRAGIETLAADMSDAEGVAELPLVENVFYLAGIKFGTSSAPDALDRMNVRMPKLVAERYRESRIVALSTGCVYSFTTPESGGSREGDPTDPPGAYAQSCLGREGAFQEISERFGTPCVLVRLNYSIDLRYGVLVDIAQKVLAGDAVDVETGYVNVIWQGDAIDYIIRCLTLAASPPRVVNVTGTETLAVRDLAERFATKFGRPVTFVGREAPTAWLNNAAFLHQTFGPPSVSVDQMVDWIAAWLSAGGETWNKPTHFETRDGNY